MAAPNNNSNLKELMEFNTNSHLPIKLSGTNYSAWYKQCSALLIASDLEGFVTGTKKCPPATIVTGETTSPNPDHSLWIRQDKLIYLALLGSYDSEARSVIATSDMSYDAWTSLARAFSN
ncbi:unnamed protein product [Vicia faba]|uniref:Retrotransposon Copia-like N-terminal domain-containing protein n=1 Tax=Vicia faba TaxID=3906 RepID=A0AAV1AUT4_VICFA|nr:unnamed protein product [Vicia faba]